MNEIKIFGNINYRKTSTTELNTLQFKEYIDKIIIFAGEQGIILPNPDDLHFAEFQEFYEQYL